MSFLYATADKIGKPNHGGGSVTHYELAALKTLGSCEVYGRGELQGTADNVNDPWGWDDIAYEIPRYWSTLHPNKEYPKLSHFYAGCFSQTVGALQKNGCKVSYTAAAHSIEVSRREHLAIGVPYDYPHLTDPELWKRYVAGYLAADILIVPSTHSAEVMKSFGADPERIRIIPHGVDLPKCKLCDGGKRADPTGLTRCPECEGSGIAPIKPPPQSYRVGYLGSCTAPDKGVRYLLEAWKMLNWKDATLVLGGHDSDSQFADAMIRTFGGGNIEVKGWVDNVSDFYNGINCYVQPSCTEGLSLEVLEAMAHGRPVVCSDGAGAADCVSVEWRVKSCNAIELAGSIDTMRKLASGQSGWQDNEQIAKECRAIAENYTWDKIRERYIQVWKEMLK